MAIYAGDTVKGGRGVHGFSNADALTLIRKKGKKFSERGWRGAVVRTPVIPKKYKSSQIND